MENCQNIRRRTILQKMALSSLGKFISAFVFTLFPYLMRECLMLALLSAISPLVGWSQIHNSNRLQVRSTNPTPPQSADPFFSQTYRPPTKNFNPVETLNFCFGFKDWKKPTFEFPTRFPDDVSNKRKSKLGVQQIIEIESASNNFKFRNLVGFEIVIVQQLKIWFNTYRKSIGLI